MGLVAGRLPVRPSGLSQSKQLQCRKHPKESRAASGSKSPGQHGRTKGSPVPIDRPLLAQNIRRQFWLVTDLSSKPYTGSNPDRGILFPRLLLLGPSGFRMLRGHGFRPKPPSSGFSDPVRGPCGVHTGRRRQVLVGLSQRARSWMFLRWPARRKSRVRCAVKARAYTR